MLTRQGTARVLHDLVLADNGFPVQQHQGPFDKRRQGFNLLPVTGDKPFKNYRYRLYFLANENGKARYVRLMFITDPFSTLTLRDISLDITAYEINRMDSTYVKFKEKEAKRNR